MSAATTIRAARKDEANRLTELCLRSKAHWGYDKQFLDQCREALTVRDEWISRGQVIVAEYDGEIAGVAAIAPDGPEFEVALFFVEPAQMGKGVGGALYAAMLTSARQHRIVRLKILSDPNAVPFYQKMGARMVGTEPSDAIPGRSLPLLEIDLTD